MTEKNLASPTGTSEHREAPVPRSWSGNREVKSGRGSRVSRPGFLDVAWAWLVFHTVWAWVEIGRWYAFRRECAWCKCRLGGNPWGYRITHGICPACSKKLMSPTANN